MREISDDAGDVAVGTILEANFAEEGISVRKLKYKNRQMCTQLLTNAAKEYAALSKVCACMLTQQQVDTPLCTWCN